MTPTLPIHHLPTEIQRAIVACLPLTTLRNLSLLNRHWHDISQDALYHTANISPISLPLLLRTLLTPGLTKLCMQIRVLSINWHSVTPPEPIAASDVPLFSAAAKQHNLPPDCSSTGTYVMLLLHLLPHVRELHLAPPNLMITADEFLDIGLVTRPPPLNTVRSLSMTWPIKQYGVSKSVLAELFALPSLRCLEVHLIHDFLPSFEMFPPGSSAVTELRISHWRLTRSNKALARMLAIPHALHHLSFSVSTMGKVFHLPEFYKAVDQLKDTLQVLEVRLGRVGNHSCEGRRRSAAPPPHSFADWPHLRVLRCPLQALLGDNRAGDPWQLADVVPQGIQELAIASDDFWMCKNTVEVFEALMWRKVKNGLLPDLVKGTLHLYPHYYGVNWHPTKALCQRAGVQLVVE